jgi:hypothetical protein
MLFNQTGQLAFVYFPVALFWRLVFKRVGFLKLFLPDVIPFGINAKRLVHFLKGMPRVFIFNYTPPKFFIVCHAV